MGMSKIMKPNPIQFRQNTSTEPFPGTLVSDEGGSYDVNMEGYNDDWLARIEATIDLATSDDKPLKVTLINYPVDDLALDEWLQSLYFYNISAIVLISTQHKGKVNEKQDNFDKYWSLVKYVLGDCTSWPRAGSESSGTCH